MFLGKRGSTEGEFGCTEKKVRRQEANRIAAAKYRERKNGRIKELQTELDILQRELRKNESIVSSLSKETGTLDEHNSSLRHQVASLEVKVHSVRERNNVLFHELATLQRALGLPCELPHILEDSHVNCMTKPHQPRQLATVEGAGAGAGASAGASAIFQRMSGRGQSGGSRTSPFQTANVDPLLVSLPPTSACSIPSCSSTACSAVYSSSSDPLPSFWSSSSTSSARTSFGIPLPVYSDDAMGDLQLELEAELGAKASALNGCVWPELEVRLSEFDIAYETEVLEGDCSAPYADGIWWRSTNQYYNLPDQPDRRSFGLHKSYGM